MKFSWEKIKKSWEYRSVAFIGKIFLVLLMLCYIYTGSSALMTLIKKEHIRQQDISFLATVIKKSVDARKPEAVTKWVSFRPLEETAALITAITPKSGKLGPDIFFELFRRKLQQNKAEEALFWLQLARFRLRYDTLRCGAGGQTEFLDKILRMASSEKINTLLQENPALVRKSIRQVMDFDARHPADNHPSFICDMIAKIAHNNAPPLPQEQWTPIRLGLHQSTEAALEQMDGKQPE